MEHSVTPKNGTLVCINMYVCALSQGRKANQTSFCRESIFKMPWLRCCLVHTAGSSVEENFPYLFLPAIRRQGSSMRKFISVLPRSQTYSGIVSYHGCEFKASSLMHTVQMMKIRKLLLPQGIYSIYLEKQI